MRDAFALSDEPYLRQYGSATVTPATLTVVLRQRLAFASSFCPPLSLTCRVTGRWAPAECDTCIRTAAPSDPGTGSTGCWSWLPGTEKSVKSLATLQQSYLDTVGNNANLLLNMAPDRRGLVPDSDMSAYRALGQWVNASFGEHALLASATNLGGEKTSLKTTTKLARTPTAVVMMEDLTQGQRVHAWSLELSTGDEDLAWLTIANGTSIGHKRIQPLDADIAKGWAAAPSSELRLRVTRTDARATGPAVIHALRVY